MLDEITAAALILTSSVVGATPFVQLPPVAQSLLMVPIKAFGVKANTLPASVKTHVATNNNPLLTMLLFICGIAAIKLHSFPIDFAKK
ncbi:MAG: hypothetical protein A2Y07_08145 [Planctomycetes bacterium GWF2_50_10]|nr:MAG: hypothetical protein A2Y07_08145 [Planctomycetes bacterium GWF2_50_10]